MTKLDPHDKASIIYVCLIPVLVLLSGVFAGLTLGYMSLDTTQLNVLSISGTPQQREYAKKIKPIRKNGHLLLVTLLVANMVVNEALPLIADKVLGSSVQSLLISTVLIVIFAEVIPQSVFTRHGLYLGAKLALPTKLLIYGLGIVSWPIAKILELALGPHHGIIYRRAELKELIALHSRGALHGGDLKNDTVTIIGATLDLQEKVVEQAMTPISDVFMLSIESKLDYETLKQISLTGHSRVPVYEVVDVPVQIPSSPGPSDGSHITKARPSNKPQPKQRLTKVKKIIGILLVKQCVLLDPKDAVPLRKIPLNKVPFVPYDEPLLGILDKFQEGRSHMAIVSRFSAEKAASVKHAVKHGLTRRLMLRVGMGDTSESDSESDVNGQGETNKKRNRKQATSDEPEQVNGNVDGDEKKGIRISFRERGRSKRSRRQRQEDLEAGVGGSDDHSAAAKEVKGHRPSFQLSALEQSMPADAVLAKEGANEFLQGIDPTVNPLGIITLEDVLEELIGEEIYDEFDTEGAHANLSSYVPPRPPVTQHNSQGVNPPPQNEHSRAQSDAGIVAVSGDETGPRPATSSGGGGTALVPMALKNLNFLRSRSAPPIPREETKMPAGADGENHVAGEDAARISGEQGAVVSDVTSVVAPRPVVASGTSAQTLEALLLERKGRSSATPLNAGGGTRAVTGSVRGMRFKSSPLIVSGKAKEDVVESSGAEGEEEDGVRIPEEKDKEGPDKA